MAAYRVVVELDPTDLDARCQLGALLHASSDLEAAKRCFTSAIRVRPTHPRAWNHLGCVLQV